MLSVGFGDRLTQLHYYQSSWIERYELVQFKRTRVPLQTRMWLGLSAVGYFCTGLGLRSRSFFLTGIVHLLAIAVLPHVGMWQFLTTGAVMAISLIFLAEVQWDMRSPIEYSLLTVEQQQFNQQQQQLRQMAFREDF